jgi:hypothetical protein
MNIIHFVNVATSVNIGFVKDIQRNLPGNHVVVNQDPHSYKHWRIEDTDIEVWKELEVTKRIVDSNKTDIILNYTETPQFCPRYIPRLDIGCGVPNGEDITYYSVDVDNFKQVKHTSDICKTIDLDRDDYDLINGKLAFYIKEDHHHDLRRMLECMAAGIPMVVNRTPDTSLLVFNGVNGILLRNPDDVDNVLMTLIKDPETRQELGEQSRFWVKENADIKKVLEFITHKVQERPTICIADS